MKLSCLPVSFYNDITNGQRTLVDWFNFAAELGLDGADVSVAHLQNRSTAELADLRRAAAAAGVQIATVVTYCDFTQPDKTNRARQVDLLKSHIQQAAQLGASYMRVTAGQAHAGVERAAGIDWAAEGLMACLSEAAEADIALLYENHMIGYGWTQPDFSLPADIFLAIAARTAGSGLGILFDTANNLVTNDDPVAVVKEVKDRIQVIHASDIRQAGHFEPVVLGTGAAPVVEVFKVMIDNGYDGWVSVEEASRSGETGFRQAIPYADRAWVEAGGQPRQKQPIG
jgi:sugar phosphate isomerase/epimerase